MSKAPGNIHSQAEFHDGSVRPLRIFAPWRLQAYGYTLAAVYVIALMSLYLQGMWVVDSTGRPVLADFAMLWIAGSQALQGETASLYDPAQFANVQAAAAVHMAPSDEFYPNFPYPPIFLLIMAPFALLPCAAAFLTFECVTLLGYVAVVFLIVRRLPAIALVLASPFTVWNFGVGQTGFLRASLVGAALLALERQPVPAGVFIGCLTFKPQFGILFPVALAAARQWRAFASAAMTAAVLAGISVAAFGTGPWEAFPRQLLAQTGDYLLRDSPIFSKWSNFETVYGLVRALDGSTALAWVAQGCVSVGVAVIVWLVWRAQLRYSLKAAILSVATLTATPYGWAEDMTVIAISLAFLARDQICYGLLRGEQMIIIALVGAGFLILLFLGSLPIGPIMTITLMGVLLRRVFSHGRGSEPVVAA